ncbi:hypothetical protein AHAS_Ahas10G0112000 [Arachis hypogaea]
MFHQKVIVAAAERRNNRRALQDIGNLVAKQAEQNVTKRNTRNQALNLRMEQEWFQLMGVGVRNFIATTKLEAAKKPPTEHEVIVISSDDESEKEKKRKPEAARGRKIKEGVTRENAKDFSSVLSTRSKAASGLSYMPKKVVNIVATDMDNELAVVEYIDDINKFYRLTKVLQLFLLLLFL